MADWLTAVRSAFDAMRTTGPKGLLRRVAMEAEDLKLKGEPTAILKKAIGDKASHIREELHNRLAEWDFDGAPSWTTTERNTADRREEIYRLLELPADLVAAIRDDLPPQTSEIEVDMVITEHAADRWYTPEFRRDREFYWPAFRDYLKKQKGWPEETLNSLSESANRIVENLAPPHSEKPTARRGLVVGYVQSGKTTNFTAVAAKAIDAGYRLIIVLGGTLDILRRQTQRRLDMELIGVENINVIEGDKEHEYASDSDFPHKFVSFGVNPSDINKPSIKRLTTSASDLEPADSHQVLAFDELRGNAKAYTLDSIKKTNVRFMVIKKTVKRLKDLVKELKHAKQVAQHLPALIIDDESDQASVNTQVDEDERSATNRLIVETLRLLPRAQYVGYTATPFANVLVDPNQEEDIFPRDFIVSLPRPPGYMGVADFNDMNAAEGEPTPNKDAHVRQFEANDEGTSLDRAMDAFVVAGAIKLFRERQGARGDFKHHTMMIHEQVQNVGQSERRDEVLKRWKSAGYSAPGQGPKRLREALEKEFRPTWQSLAPDLPFPTDYDALKPFIGEALKKIEPTRPIIIVNGAQDGEDPEFDKRSVWKIIIGGAKLSRGFTVEGLTVTYFGRRAAQQDTLMQMGRWFGYRAGYRDLVRLFLERADGRKFDLYEAFEALCRDEESFRTQLRRYLRPENGGQGIRPIEVPAVVFNSYPRLTPTSRNKMFSAVLDEDYVSDGWKYPVDVSLAKKDLDHNWELLEQLVNGRLKETDLTAGGRNPKLALYALLSRADATRFLDSLRWKDGAERLSAERTFFRSNPVAADQWAVVLPQLQNRSGKLGTTSVSVHERSPQDDGSFKAFTDPKDVKLTAAASREGSSELRGRALLVVYPATVPEKVMSPPIVGLAIFHPIIPREHQVARFTVRAPHPVMPRKG